MPLPHHRPPGCRGRGEVGDGDCQAQWHSGPLCPVNISVSSDQSGHSHPEETEAACQALCPMMSELGSGCLLQRLLFRRECLLSGNDTLPAHQPPPPPGTAQWVPASVTWCVFPAALGRWGGLSPCSLGSKGKTSRCDVA